MRTVDSMPIITMEKTHGFISLHLNNYTKPKKVTLI